MQNRIVSDLLVSGKPAMNESSGTGAWSPAASSPAASGPIEKDSAAIPKSRPRREPMQMSSLVMLVFWVALADWLIYRTAGFAGPALFVALVPLFFLSRWNSHWIRQSSGTVLIFQGFCIAVLWLAALRLMFVGSWAVVLAAMVTTTTLALAASRVVPSAFESIAMLLRGPIDGLVWFASHRMPSITRAINGSVNVNASQAGVLNWLLPALATVLFGGIFVLANPSLIDFVSLRFTWISNWTWSWLSRLLPGEMPFCVLALLVGAGLFYPRLSKKRIGGVDADVEQGEPQSADLFPAFRNTLLCLIALFAVYLVFEFITLWTREFPAGFYYAGYAHQGAAWLTAALALATCVLSLIFRGEMLRDDRLGQMRTLAWVWSGANFLLAIAVYNRLGIYVGYNGLTPMRIVGFFGITVVVIGFCLVLLKIARSHGFWWLIRNQLTALMFCLVALAIFPVDYVSHRYNVNQVLDGYLPPSVMIAVKEKDDSGRLPMVDLLECDDPVIREGVRAMLAERQAKFEIDRERNTEGGLQSWHWTRYQHATNTLADGLAENDDLIRLYRRDSGKRNQLIQDFRDYAMQWY